MIRAAFVVLFLTALPAIADEPKTPDYFPRPKGAKWEYLITVDGKEHDFITEGGETTIKDGKRIVRGKIRVGASSWVEEYTVDEKGLYLTEGAGGKFDPPRTVLRYPLKSGDTWTEKFKEGDSETVAKNTVRDLEMVEVSAGKFKAFPVDTVMTAMGQTTTSTTWYANDVGIIKMTVMNKPNPINITLELKKFTPGK